MAAGLSWVRLILVHLYAPGGGVTPAEWQGNRLADAAAKAAAMAARLPSGGARAPLASVGVSAGGARCSCYGRGGGLGGAHGPAEVPPDSAIRPPPLPGPGGWKPHCTMCTVVDGNVAAGRRQAGAVRMRAVQARSGCGGRQLGWPRSALPMRCAWRRATIRGAGRLVGVAVSVAVAWRTGAAAPSAAPPGGGAQAWGRRVLAGAPCPSAGWPWGSASVGVTLPRHPCVPAGGWPPGTASLLRAGLYRVSTVGRYSQHASGSGGSPEDRFSPGPFCLH